MTLSKQCDHCGRPFKPTAEAPHKRFCSKGCRVNWHLQRQKRATELLGEITSATLIGIAQTADVTTRQAARVLIAAGLQVEENGL